MLLGGKRVFERDQKKLYTLLNFRAAGYTYHSLAELFHADRDSVSKQCEKFCIIPFENPISVRKEITRILKNDRIKNRTITSEWIVIDGEKINAGHSYEDYLKKARLSPLKRLV